MHPSTAVRTAERTCAPCGNVEFDVGTVPQQWPTGTFDLIVLSEIGYYVDREGVARLRDRALDSLDAGGTLVAVHWLGSSPDHVLHGDAVHDALDDPRLDHCVSHRDRSTTPGFRTDIWRTRG